MNHVRARNALSALRRAGIAVDTILESTIREIRRGFLPDKTELIEMLDFGSSVASRVDEFVAEVVDWPPSKDDWDLLLSSTLLLGQLEDSLRGLKDAVSWSSRASGFNWWLRRRLHEFEQDQYIVVASPGSARDFVIEQVPRLKERFAEAASILALTDFQLERLSRVRVLTVPHHDGSSARWHPISLGHELAHLRYNKQWVEDWLSKQDVTEPGAHADAIAIAKENGPAPQVTEPVWYTGLVSWLSESACDAAMSFIYGNEGIVALESYLDVNSPALDKSGHPSPDLRIAALSGDDAKILEERFRPPIRDSANARSRKSAFTHLVLSCRQSVRDDLALLPFEPHESQAAYEDALADVGRDIPPQANRWPREVIEVRPTSIESALVRTLWSSTLTDGEGVLQSDDWRRLDVLESRVDHSVDFLQFAQRFYTGSTASRTKVKDDPSNALFVGSMGVRRSSSLQEGDTSHDVRLGRHFIVFRRNEISSLNALESERFSSRIQEGVEVGWGERFVLHPGEMVLAVTLEQLIVDKDVCAQVLSRSSIGRMGLLSATAVHVQPGFTGCLTLELVNLASVPLTISPGQRVAQVVPLPVVGTSKAYDGKYQNQDWHPKFSAASDDWEMPILNVMQMSSSRGE